MGLIVFIAGAMLIGFGAAVAVNSYGLGSRYVDFLAAHSVWDRGTAMLRRRRQLARVVTSVGLIVVGAGWLYIASQMR